jgi:hypothetical protein
MGENDRMRMILHVPCVDTVDVATLSLRPSTNS